MDKDKKYKRFYVDWWTIRRSTIYGLIAFLLIGGGLAYGGWWLWENKAFDKGEETPINAAVISSFEGDVRIIRSTSKEIIRVTKTTYVEAGDTIQTQADGKATVRMIDGSTLTVRPNSTVVVRDNTSIFGGTNVRVSLGGGQINIKTEDQADGAQNIVEVKQVENKIASQTEANFGINQKTDTGEIRISRGTVESNANGEKVVLKADEYAPIQTGKVLPKEKLLDAPKLIAPATLDTVFVSDAGTTNMTLRWQRSDNLPTAYYRLEVATSPFFVPETMIEEKEPLPSPSFPLAKIKAGNYFWRVRSVATSGQVSEWSDPWKFTVATRDAADTLTLSDLKTENIGGNVYVLSGKTHPGTIIRILGRETFAVGDGSFRIQVSAPSNDVSLELANESGGKTRYLVNMSAGKASRQN